MSMTTADTTTSTREATWLAIQLDVVRRAELAVFSITFTNTSHQPQELPFSNLSRKAELLGLRLKDVAGTRLAPERTFIGRAAAYTEPSHHLPAGHSWTYELIGTVEAATLTFSGALYRVAAGCSYQISFVYKGITSNVIEVSFLRLVS